MHFLIVKDTEGVTHYVNPAFVVRIKSVSSPTDNPSRLRSILYLSDGLEVWTDLLAVDLLTILEDVTASPF